MPAIAPDPSSMHAGFDVSRLPTRKSRATGHEDESRLVGDPREQEEGYFRRYRDYTFIPGREFVLRATYVRVLTSPLSQIVTTYEMIIKDQRFLSRYAWKVSEIPQTRCYANR